MYNLKVEGFKDEFIIVKKLKKYNHNDLELDLLKNMIYHRLEMRGIYL